MYNGFIARTTKGVADEEDKMAYKMDKAEVVEMVARFTAQITETASKIGEISAFGFLYGDDEMMITAETVALQSEKFAATLRVYI